MLHNPLGPHGLSQRKLTEKRLKEYAVQKGLSPSIVLFERTGKRVASKECFILEPTFNVRFLSLSKQCLTLLNYVPTCKSGRKLNFVTILTRWNPLYDAQFAKYALEYGFPLIC